MEVAGGLVGRVTVGVVVGACVDHDVEFCRAEKYDEVELTGALVVVTTLEVLLLRCGQLVTAGLQVVTVTVLVSVLVDVVVLSVVWAAAAETMTARTVVKRLEASILCVLVCGRLKKQKLSFFCFLRSWYVDPM